jgi:hypothetical protein
MGFYIADDVFLDEGVPNFTSLYRLLRNHFILPDWSGLFLLTQ